ncbi:MAG: hypothetical protein R2731_10755 [Nocardioides sp.]
MSPGRRRWTAPRSPTPRARRSTTAEGASRLKSPPVREVDIAIRRDLLDADPATALGQTRRIAAAVSSVAAHQDYLLDNITNTLGVAAQDAAVAKRLFAFLGVPGALLAQYSRRTPATCSPRRSAASTRRSAFAVPAVATSSACWSCAPHCSRSAVRRPAWGWATWPRPSSWGAATLASVSASALVASALAGTLGGLVATGTALYVTGWRSIDREINADRARLDARRALWLRGRVGLVALLGCVAATIWALRAHAFAGAPARSTSGAESTCGCGCSCFRSPSGAPGAWWAPDCWPPRCPERRPARLHAWRRSAGRWCGAASAGDRRPWATPPSSSR